MVAPLEIWPSGNIVADRERESLCHRRPLRRYRLPEDPGGLRGEGERDAGGGVGVCQQPPPINKYKTHKTHKRAHRCYSESESTCRATVGLSHPRCAHVILGEALHVL